MLIECKELQEGITPNFHGEDVGVCTLEALKYYRLLANKTIIHAKKEQVDRQEVYDYYGKMAEDVKKLYFPENIIDAVEPKAVEEHWQEIREIIGSAPTFEECETAMRAAGCKLTLSDIHISQKLYDGCFRFSPYMRKRITLLRLNNIMEY